MNMASRLLGRLLFPEYLGQIYGILSAARSGPLDPGNVRVNFRETFLVFFSTSFYRACVLNEDPKFGYCGRIVGRLVGL